MNKKTTLKRTYVVKPTHKHKYIKHGSKGCVSDSLLPIGKVFEEGEAIEPRLTRCEVSRIKYVKVKLHDLRSLMRCAQIIQMNLNNRLDASQGIFGDVKKVPLLRCQHDTVCKLMKEVAEDVAKNNNVELSPNTFI